MSYFKASLGKKPEQTNVPNTTPADQKPAGPKPYFAAQTGLQQPSSKALIQPESLCPLCRSPLRLENGLYHCTGRCRGRWLQESPGRLVDTAALPYGLCSCCTPPHALIKGDKGAVCPVSGNEYLVLAHGPVLVAQAAPLGLCQCCQPPMPLIQLETSLVCQANPQQHYQKQGDQIILLAKAPVSPADLLAAIDQALLANNATVTLHGLFNCEL